MAGIINTASTKAGNPLAPLDPGDFQDPPQDPNDPTAGDGTTKPEAVNDNPLAPGGSITNTGTPATTNPLAPAGTAPGVAQDATTTPPAGGSGSVDPNATVGAGTQSVGNSANATAGATGAATGSGTTGTGSDNPLSWNPTSGIINQIQGITPQTVTGTGYTASTMGDTQAATAEGYTPTDYTAAQGTAVGSDENVSQAVDRITGANSPILQRAQAQAQDQANARGLGNSTMAVEAGTSAVLDKAISIAQGDIQNAQFNAAEKNAMTISNVQQANAAAAFHAQATNDAAAFGAAARNQVSQFNSAQSQQKMEFAAQQWDAAAAFSAQAKQAADTFNADGYNKAMQSYMDAKNAAIAAQNDAVNLSRRDTAQINAGLKQAQIGADATAAAASIHAGAMVASAQIGAEASSKNLAASIEAQRSMQANDIKATNDRYQLGLSQQQQQFASTLSANQFDQFQSGLNNIQLAQLEPDAKQNAVDNYLSVWSTSGTLPFTINAPGP